MKKEIKGRYLEYVMLTDEQYAALLSLLGQDALAEWIEELNDYLGQSEKNRRKYDSHYHTIRAWARRAGKKKTPAADSSAEVNILLSAIGKHDSLPADLPKHIADRCMRMCQRLSVGWGRLHHRMGMDPDAGKQITRDYLETKG
jgi:hypothetical protein